MEFAPGECLDLRRSPHQRIEVRQSGRLRLLHTDHLALQSALDLDHPRQLVLTYMQAMMTVFLFRPPPTKVLLLGLGGGDLLRYLYHHLPNTRLKAVEIDATMVTVARDWFELPQDERLQVMVDDGIRFLHEDEACYELLMVDIYSGRKPPPALLDSAFYQDCYRRLTNDGIVVLNLLTTEAETFRAVLWHLRQQFDRATLCLSVPDQGNIIIFAFRRRPSAVKQPALRKRAAELREILDLDLNAWAQQLFSTNPTAGGELLF